MSAKSTPDKIRSYAHLPKGWHYGSGDRLSSRIIELALSAEKMLRASGFPETDCFLGDGGEIQVCGYLPGPSGSKSTCVTVEISEETY